MEYVRYKTLFKCEKSKPILVDDPIDGQIIFPEYLGVDSSIWKNQTQETNTFINLAIERDRYRSHEFAILLACAVFWQPWKNAPSGDIKTCFAGRLRQGMQAARAQADLR